MSRQLCMLSARFRPVGDPLAFVVRSISLAPPRRLCFVPPAVAQLVRRVALCCACILVLSSAAVASAAPASAPADVVAPGIQVADLAQQLVGSRYAWGGSSPAGFDCTGLVMWVFDRFGVSLPRNEAGQLASGDRISADDLQPGDVLVFANTYRGGLSHVGIYVGDGRFVHAVDERHGVLVSNLWDGYWGPRLVGASRALA
jgi:cell wall-associated NlpC family hydrolase